MLRAAGLAAALLFVALEFIGMRDFARAPYTGIQHNNLVVSAIERNSPNLGAGLRFGDRILSVNGAPVRNVDHYHYLVASAPPPSSIALEVARGDSVFTAIARGVPQPAGRITGKLSNTVVAFTFVLIGLIVLLKRPDILGALFAAACYILSYLITERPVTGSPPLHIVGELWYDFLFIFLPAFFLHFFLVFPGRDIERGSRRAALARYLYAPPAVLLVLTFAAALRRYGAPGDPGLARSIERINMLTVLMWFAYIVASLSLFIRTYFASTRVQRIKFRIVIVGVAAGIVPLTVLMLLKQFRPEAAVPARYLWPLSLSFMPFSFAYVIVRHNAFDLAAVLRSALVYLMLLALVLAVYFALVNVLGDEIGRRFGVPISAVAAGAIVLLAVAVAPIRAVLQRAVDPLFARRRSAHTEEIVAFSRRIQFLRSLEEVSQFVAGRMIDILRAEHALLFLRTESGEYSLRAGAPAGKRTPLTSFPPETAFIRLMREERVPLMLEYFDRLWLKNNLDRISRELISITQSAAAVPFIEQDELFGFALLGRKNSGRPYAALDAEVLELLGERCAAALANIKLCGDSIVKERLEEELRLASDIQTRLLPAVSPSLRCSAIAAKLANSREVGGDFYDFVEFDEGVIGIAVADVSGKGIPAALLMTTLQASFRAEAANTSAPREIVSALNASLYERSDPEKFATLFCAAYEDESGIMRFTNAGSYPPFILSSDGRVSRLQRGGILIGVEPRSSYLEGVVRLREGDLVVMYTDGCIDQEDASGEPFGEERLLEFFRNNAYLSVDAMIEKLFATIVAFGQRNLKDDMTAVLLRRIAP